RRDAAAVGGRPRRGETAEDARLRRRQTHLALPFAGGKVETAETDAKPVSEPRAPARAAAACLERKGAAMLTETGFGDEIAAIAGLDGARGHYDYRPIDAWIAGGASRELIRETISTRVSRPGYKPPRSLAYFNECVAEAMRAPKASPPDPSREAA